MTRTHTYPCAWVYTWNARRKGPLHACVGLVMGQTVEVGKKREREKAWDIVRVFQHIQ